MGLSSAEAAEIIKKRPSQPAVDEALNWQAHVRFHGLTVKSKKASAHWPVFLAWVEGFLLNAEKRAAFEAFFPFPNVTNRLLSEVQDGWMKLFDAANPLLSIVGGDGVAEDFMQYLKETGEPDFWYREAVSTLLESPNDFLVVDASPGPGRVRPYFKRLALDSVVDVKILENGVCEHMAYLADDGTVVYMDDTCWRLYVKDEESGEYMLIPGSESFHALGYCPARLFWDERAPGHPVGVSSPVDEVLSQLDKYCYDYTAVNLFRLYGLFPITWSLKAQQIAPVLPVLTGDPGEDDPRACAGRLPAAFGSNMVGPGDHYEVDLPQLPQGADPRPPAGIIEPSIETARFTSEDLTSQKSDIIQYLIGSGGESMLQKEAVNDKQVQSTFTTKENVLRYLSQHLSAARQWVIETSGKLRYGTLFIACEASFGTEFYLKNDAEQLADIQSAKNAGLPQTLLLQMVESYQQYRLRAIPGEAGRTRMLSDLEPYFPLSQADCNNLLLVGLVGREDVAVKAQFLSLIKRFERESGVNLTEWGEPLPYAERIERINQYLYENAKTEEVQPPETRVP